MYFPTVLEVGKFKIKVPADSVPDEVSPSDLWRAAFSSQGREKECSLSF